MNPRHITHRQATAKPPSIQNRQLAIKLGYLHVVNFNGSTARTLEKYNQPILLESSAYSS
jgi:hypothetical protein